MKVCFAVQQDNGVESVVYNHFGSAPSFIMIDTDGDVISTVSNRDKDHAHGACNPIACLLYTSDAADE